MVLRAHACALTVGIALGGCDARFVDERPLALRGTHDLGAAATPLDLYGLDLRPGVLAAGAFVGRAGHFGTGEARLSRLADGRLQLDFDDSFAITDVPGPEVLLTARGDLGATVSADDLDLGLLVRAEGAQSYTVPLVELDARRNVFVYCRPFGLEVAKATLQPPP
jgi:hypothetical protein